MTFGGGHDLRRRLSAQIKGGRERAEQIFGKVQATLSLHCILKVAIPETVCIDLAVIMSEVKRRQVGVGRNSRQSIFFINVGVKRTILVRGAVIVAESD